jgi:hypothetical protein
MAQWVLLRIHFRGAGSWILASTAGWLLGGLAAQYSNERLLEPFSFIAGFALTGLIAGVATGLALTLISKRSISPQAGKSSSYAPAITTAGAVILAVVAVLWQPAAASRINLSTLPEVGTVPACPDLPPLECEGGPDSCAEVVFFEPIEGPGYTNYPINDETQDDQYRSYIRRDLMMVIQRAAARMACETAGWAYREMEPLGLGDMSEADGAIPGTSTGHPDHPEGTHIGGTDIDIAYFQSEMPDGNVLRPICKYTTYGLDAFRCTQAPHLLDPWRSALMIAHIAQHPRIRVVGVDGQVGPLLESALDQLVESGWLDAGQRARIPLTYEETPEGRGWYLHHHHHMHFSMSDENRPGPASIDT